MSLLATLALGVALIAAANLALAGRLGATRAALLSALAAAGGYGIVAAIDWPGGDVLAIHLAVYLMSAYLCGVWLGPREKARGKPPGRRFHWGPAAIVGFFGLLLAVDSVLILLAERGLSPRLGAELLPEARQKGAVSSAFPGVISHDFKEKEVLYNQYLSQVERQRERGWRIRKGWLGQPLAGAPATFKITAQTREGEPLTGAEVTGRFLRPSDSRLDREFTMREAQPGVYLTDLTLPAAGVWNLVLQLRQGDELHEIRARTAVAPNPP